MAFIHWADWTKPRAWRKLAEEHTDEAGENYIVIGHANDDEDEEPFELLRLSRFSAKLDKDKLALRTSIREFDETPAEMSRRTRDLGVTRFITNKGKPIFVLESGADALRWMAIREGVTEKELISIARRGEVGRAVRRKDRRALKASQEEVEATIRANMEQKQSLESDLAQTKMDLANAQDAHDRMVQNIVSQNKRKGNAPDHSGSLGCTLGAAEERGVKLSTNKPLHGSFGG